MARKSVATDARPIQHTKKQGCGVQLRFSCRGTKGERNVCVLMSFFEEHSHLCTKDMYEQEIHKIENQDEIKSMKEALLTNVKAGQIRNLMRVKYGKSGISMRHVRYMMWKMKVTDAEGEDLAAFLEGVEEEGDWLNHYLMKINLLEF